MKYILTIVTGFLLLSSVFALEIKSSSKLSLNTTQQSIKEQNMDSCWLGGSGSDKATFDSSCFRKKMNALSTSKAKACGYEDALHKEMIVFDWKYNNDYYTINESFVKIGSKLYYIIKEGKAEGDGWDNYLYVYDCKQKKSKQLKQGFKGELSWVDVSGKKVYISRDFSKYLPIIYQIDTKSNKVNEFELITRIDSGNGENEVVSSSFKWGTSLKSKIEGYLKKYGLDKYSSDFKLHKEGLLDDMSQLDADMGIVIKDISNGVGKIVLQYPGFDVVGAIDFNKKTIK